MSASSSSSTFGCFFFLWFVLATRSRVYFLRFGATFRLIRLNKAELIEFLLWRDFYIYLLFILLSVSNERKRWWKVNVCCFIKQMTQGTKLNLIFDLHKQLGHEPIKSIITNWDEARWVWFHYWTKEHSNDYHNQRFRVERFNQHKIKDIKE